MTVVHRNMTGAELHESKGVSTADNGAIYAANGVGSGTWITPPVIDPSAVSIPIGTTGEFAGFTAPPGWSFCFGQELSRSIYEDLFNEIGEVFGPGNGSTTFNLPDARGRVLEATSPTTDIAETGGAQTAALILDNIPSLTGSTNTTGAHFHAMSPSGSYIISASSFKAGGGGTFEIPSFASTGNHSHSLSINASSPNNPHNNVQPSMIMNVIIYHGVL